MDFLVKIYEVNVYPAIHKKKISIVYFGDALLVDRKSLHKG